MLPSEVGMVFNWTVLTLLLPYFIMLSTQCIPKE